MPIRPDELRSIPYLAALGSESLAALLPRIQERHRARCALLFLEGDPCDGLYYVQAGRVTIWQRCSRRSPTRTNRPLLARCRVLASASTRRRNR